MQLIDGLAHLPNGSIAVAAPCRFPRAAHKSVTGMRKRARLRSHMSRAPRHQFKPRVDGRPCRPDSAARQPMCTRPSPIARSLLALFGRPYRIPRSRAPRSHRLEAPRTASRKTVGPGDGTGEGFPALLRPASATASWRFLAPSGAAQPPPSGAAPCQRDRQR